MIEEIYLYNADFAVSMQNFFDYLLENAVPKYFGKVEINEEKTEISCFINEDDENYFLKIAKREISVKTEYSNQTFVVGGATSFANLTYVYKCSDSISVCYNSNTSGMSINEKTIKFTIAKDNDGNTIVISVGSNSIQTNSNANAICVANQNSVIIQLRQCANLNSALSFSGKIPYPVGNTNNYTTDVFMLPFINIASVATPEINIDGVEYLTNGLWLVMDNEEDEES